MASKKLGNAIKQARTDAGLTQEQLARKISGLSATDISEAERGLKDLTQEQLKKIAKATGVTQSSLLDAAKSSSKKTTTKKTTTSSANKTSMKVTATEKRLVEYYRNASTEDRKQALKILKGDDDIAEDLLDTVVDVVTDLLKK